MSNIVSELILRTGLFGAGIKSAQNSLKGLQSSVSGAKGLITGAFAAISSSAMAIGLERAFNVGHEMQVLSNATGGAVKDLVVMRKAFEENGIDGEKLGQVMGKLRKNIVQAAATGSGEQFRKLGLSVKELGRTSATDQLQTIGRAIMQIQNPTERSAYAMQLFGRSGQQMLALFANGDALGEAASVLGRQAQILDDNSAIFSDITVKLHGVGSKMQGFFVGMASRVAPAIKPLLDSFSKMDFSGLGEQIGDALAFISTAFSSGELGNILYQSMMIAFANAVNFLNGSMMGILFAVGQLLVEQFKIGITLFQIVCTADFWSGMGDAIMGIAEGFVAFLLDGIALLMEKMKNIPGIGKKMSAGAEAVRSAAQTVREKGEANRSKAGDLLAPAVDKAKGQLANSMKDIGTAFNKGYDMAPKISTKENEDSMDKSIDAVNRRVARQQADADKFNEEHKPGQLELTEDMTESKNRKFGPAFVSTLMKIGGGGTSAGGGTADPILRENQRHTSLLQQLVKNTGLKTGGLKTGTLATFSL